MSTLTANATQSPHSPPAPTPQWMRRLVSRFARRPAAAPSLRSLDKGATAWVHRPLGQRIECVAGTLWLTFDNEPKDIVLETGDSHFCDKASALSIHALSAAAVRVT